MNHAIHAFTGSKASSPKIACAKGASTIMLDNKILVKSKDCPDCGKPGVEIRITPKQADEIVWSANLIQNILPNHSPEVRERFITGICEECWNYMFGEKE